MEEDDQDLATNTCLLKERQGAEGEAQDAVLGLSEGKISSDTRVKNIIDRLNKLFKKDEILQKYQALEAFETYHRPANAEIQEFFNKFEKRYNETKSYGTTVLYDIFGYRLLKSTNLSEQYKQFDKATVSNLKYDYERKISLKNSLEI